MTVLVPLPASDPALKEWALPAGVLASPEGLASSFHALGLESVAESGPDSVKFEAWRTPRVSGTILAGVLAAAVYLGFSSLGIPDTVSVVVIVLEAFYVPTALLPGYTVSGRVEGGRVAVRITAKGLLARPARLERALRFYLER